MRASLRLMATPTRYSITPSAISSSMGWHSQTQRLTPR
jgi:hypothetical protein